MLAAAARYLDQCPKALILAIGLSATALLGVLDYVTGPDLSLIVFYAAPVVFAAWFAGRSPAFFVVAACAVALMVGEVLGIRDPTLPWLPYWNMGVKCGALLLVALLTSDLRRQLQLSQELARTDELTQVDNRRAFFETAARELHRARRYHRPVTVVYLDLDDFKDVNDEHGHAAGDRVLALVAQGLRTTLRATDSIARIGGDEFALLLPETGTDAAATVFSKLLHQLDLSLGREAWHVTASVGMVTFIEAPASTDEALSRADAAMYAAKAVGRGGCRHETVGNVEGSQ